MNNNLYRQFASYYAAITADRDFKDEVECILTSYTTEHPCKSLLELFAGQARHSIEALKKGDIDVWATDGSLDMKKLAIQEGFENSGQYIVGNMPEALLKINNVQFDCIICLYHGLSNLTMRGVLETFGLLKRLLKSDGRVFLEIHDIYKIMEYISNQSIHYEEVEHPNGELIKYAWPSGKIGWNPYSFNAVVPIQLLVKTSQRLDTLEFASEDRIYSTEDIVFISSLVGLKGRIMTEHPAWKKSFEHSIILELSHDPSVPSNNNG